MSDRLLPDSMLGEQIVERLANGDDVLVQDATITGGLDFTQIPLSSIPDDAIPDSLRSVGIDENDLTNVRIIRGELRLERCRIEGNVTAASLPSDYTRPTVFCSHVTIRDSEIAGDVRFDRSVFCDGLCLDQSRFQSGCWFNRARFHSYRFSVLIRQATFERFLNLSMVEIKSDADFGRTNFESLSLQQSTLSGRIQFYNTGFKQYLNFQRTTVNGIIQFHHCDWNGGANFREARFEDHASFWGCQCRGDEDSHIDFSDAVFRRPTSFRELDLVGGACFDRARFRDEVSFRRCRIACETSFRDALFEEELSLRGAKLEGFCIFEGARLQRVLDVRSASVGKLVFNNDEKRTQIAAYVDLRWAQIGQLFLIETSPDVPTDSEGTKSRSGLIFLNNVDFEADLDLSGTQIEGDLVMTRTKCRGELDLSDGVISGSVTISDVDFRTINVRWDQFAGKLRSLDEIAAELEGRLLLSRKEEIKQQPSFTGVFRERHEPLKRVYEKLEKWFDSAGRFVEARRVRWEFERRKFYAKLRDTTGLARARLALGSLYPWAYLTIGVASKFGTSMRRLLLWTLASVVTFGVMYAAGGPNAFSHTPRDGQIKLRFYETPLLQQIATPDEADFEPDTSNRFLDSLSFSINNFIKIGYGDIRVDPKQSPPWIIGLCWFQWLLGYCWYFLFLYTFSNTAPGIKKLLMGG
jgi:uncharacterized protein YjbI with pentapeptide repeats